MAKDQFNVGIVGLQPERSWAAIAHIPALEFLSKDFHVVGVTNTSYESAKAAAEACNVPKAFENAQAMVESPDIDIVAVTVKVPHHHEIVTAALNAGKHVYCEWPLGNGLEEARELAQLAKENNLLGVVGTQAVVSPELELVKKLVADGFVGEVLSTTLVGTGMNWGPFIEEANAYTLDNKNGANMLTIPVGHTMAALCSALGPVEELSAKLATRRSHVHVVETGEDRPMTAHDQVLVSGVLSSGAPISIHYRGGMPRGTGLLWEINGTEGDIQVTGMGGHAQLVDLKVKGSKGEDSELKEIAAPKDAVAEHLGEYPYAQNVARMYERMADDLKNDPPANQRKSASFADAVVIHEFVQAVEESAQSGRSVRL